MIDGYWYLPNQIPNSIRLNHMAVSSSLNWPLKGKTRLFQVSSGTHVVSLEITF